MNKNEQRTQLGKTPAEWNPSMKSHIPVICLSVHLSNDDETVRLYKFYWCEYIVHLFFFSSSFTFSKYTKPFFFDFDVQVCAI